MSRREALQFWLAQHRRRRTALFLLGGVLVLVLSVGAILIVQWILYVLLFFSLGLLSGSLTAVTWVSWGMVGLLFLTEIFVGRKEIETLSVTTGTSSRRPVTVYLPGVGLASTVNPLAPDSAASLGKIIASCLLYAPRLTLEGLRLFPRGLAYLKLDPQGCAPILNTLLKKDGRVPFRDLVQDVPEGKDPETVFRQVVLIPGVLTLRSPPQGLSLTSDFRDELGAWIKKNKSADAAPSS